MASLSDQRSIEKEAQEYAEQCFSHRQRFPEFREVEASPGFLLVSEVTKENEQKIRDAKILRIGGTSEDIFMQIAPLLQNVEEIHLVIESYYGRRLPSGFFNHCSRLSRLEVFGFQKTCLKALAIPTLKKLTFLRAETIEGFSTALGSSNLEWINARGHHMNREIITAMTNPAFKLARLELSGWMEQEHMDMLVIALKQPYCRVWYLTLSGISISADCIGQVLLSRPCSLRVLTLDGYCVTDKFLDALEDPGCQRLQYLSIRGVRMNVFKVKRSQPWNVNYLTTDYQLMSSAEVATNLEILKVPRSYEFLRSKKLQAVIFCARDANLVIGQVVDFLETHYQSRLRSIRFFESENVEIHKLPDGMEQRLQRVLERNSLFLNSGQEDKDAFAQPSIAKLFICGDSGAGKTTVAENLESCFPYPAWLQKHRTTQGIQVKELNYKDGKKLVVCDIAGQEEFHAFHHNFIRGSDKNIFLVISKLSEEEISQVEKRLKYWLRFIASHASHNRRKPKVFIALNCFPEAKAKKDIARESVLQVVRDYQEQQVLDISGPYHIRAVVANTLHSLKKELGTALDQLLLGLSEVPKMCDIIRALKTCKQVPLEVPKTCSIIQTLQRYKRRARRIISLDDLVELSKGDNSTIDVVMNAIKFTLSCMHDMGEVLYFGLDNKNDPLLSKYVLLDVQSFLHDLVSIFMQVERGTWEKRKQSLSIVETATLGPQLVKLYPDEHHLSFVLKSLHLLGLMMPHYKEKWDATSNWSLHSPKLVTIPAILREKFPGWPAPSGKRLGDYHYWGRRLKCRDEVYTLLPSGIFTMLQVKMRNMCSNPSFRVGDGWVYFQEEDVRVVARVTGTTDSWTDRHWVDIMVMFLSVEKKTLLAEQMIAQVKDHAMSICQACPALKLVEMVMNPEFISSSIQKSETIEQEVVELSIILEEVEKHGLSYIHTWGMGSGNAITELLMPIEMQALVKRWEAEVKAAYKDCYSLATEEAVPEVRIQDIIVELEASSSTSDMRTYQILQVILRRMDEGFNRTEEGLRAVRDELQTMKASMKDLAKSTEVSLEVYGRRVLQNCSKILGKLNVTCPRLPYFTETGKITQYYLLVGKTVKLRYVCESDNPHTMNSFPGHEMTIQHEWFAKNAHIFKPAIGVLFLASKIAAKVFSLGVVEPCIDYVEKHLGRLLENTFSSEFLRSRRQASDTELRELWELATKEARSDRDVFMEKHFGLHLQGVEENDGCSRNRWVCAKCGGKRS